MIAFLRVMRVLFVIALCAGSVNCRSEPPVVASFPPPVVTISQPVEREIIDYFEYAGHTAAVEEVEIRARVSGYLVKVNFKDGTEVEKGDLLFRIDPRPFEAELAAAKGQVAQWKAKLARAEADVARLERLLPKGAASQKDLDTAIADRGEARAVIQVARAAVDKAALNLDFTKVTAPISGRVSRALVTEGNLVSADTTLLTTIVSLDPMYVYFDVDERSLLNYERLTRENKRESARVVPLAVSMRIANEEGFPHHGVIDFADNRVDPATGTLSVRAVFPNAARILTPGLFVRVRIPGRDQYDAVLVPDRVIGTDQGQKYLFVVTNEQVAEYRAVKLGLLQDDGLRVIQAGLQPGEWVVVNGIQRVRPGITLDPQRTDMASLIVAADTTPTAQ